MELRRGLLLLLAGSLLVGAAPVQDAEAPDYRTRLLGFPAQLEVVGDGQRLLGYRARTPGDEWQLPTGDAVLLDEEWWTPLQPLIEVPSRPPGPATMKRIRAQVVPAASPREPDRLTALAYGDVTLDGKQDLVLSFRRPFKRTIINATRPRGVWTDARGLSAHLGIYRPGDLSQVWVAGTLGPPGRGRRRLSRGAGGGLRPARRSGHRRDRRLALDRVRLLSRGSPAGPGQPHLCRHRR